MVTEKQGRELAERMKAPYIEASAKDNRVRLTQEIVFPHSFLRRFMELASCLAVEPKEQNQDWVVLMLPTWLPTHSSLKTGDSYLYLTVTQQTTTVINVLSNRFCVCRVYKRRLGPCWIIYWQLILCQNHRQLSNPLAAKYAKLLLRGKKLVFNSSDCFFNKCIQ